MCIITQLRVASLFGAARIARHQISACTYNFTFPLFLVHASTAATAAGYSVHPFESNELCSQCAQKMLTFLHIARKWKISLKGRTKRIQRKLSMRSKGMAQHSTFCNEIRVYECYTQDLFFTEEEKFSRNPFSNGIWRKLKCWHFVYQINCSEAPHIQSPVGGKAVDFVKITCAHKHMVPLNVNWQNQDVLSITNTLIH